MGREPLDGGGRRTGNGAHARSVSSWICAAALSAAALGLPVLAAECAFAAETSGTIARHVRNQESKGIVRAVGVTPMSRCLATWDSTSGMSRRQWKATCKRVVKRHPGLYSKPF